MGWIAPIAFQNGTKAEKNKFWRIIPLLLWPNLVCIPLATVDRLGQRLSSCCLYCCYV